MAGCPVAESSRERMLQQETSAVQRWIDEMTEQGVNGWTMTEVGPNMYSWNYKWFSLVDSGCGAHLTQRVFPSIVNIACSRRRRRRRCCCCCCGCCSLETHSVYNTDHVYPTSVHPLDDPPHPRDIIPTNRHSNRETPLIISIIFG